jgi:hypothetical protein
MKEINPDRFRNRKEAVEWLQVQGYKVSTGKFYQDIAGGNKITMHQDGSVSKWDTYQYAVKELSIATGSATGGTLAGEQIRKIRAEADMKELQFEVATRRKDRYWLHADDAWASVAALIGVLRDAIRHELDSGKSLIIEKAEGDPYRAHEVFEAMEQLISKAFNVAAGQGIDVEFVRDVEDEKSEDTNQE